MLSSNRPRINGHSLKNGGKWWKTVNNEGKRCFTTFSFLSNLPQPAKHSFHKSNPAKNGELQCAKMKKGLPGPSIPLEQVECWGVGHGRVCGSPGAAFCRGVEGCWYSVWYHKGGVVCGSEGV